MTQRLELLQRAATAEDTKGRYDRVIEIEHALVKANKENNSLILRATLKTLLVVSSIFKQICISKQPPSDPRFFPTLVQQTQILLKIRRDLGNVYLSLRGPRFPAPYELCVETLKQLNKQCNETLNHSALMQLKKHLGYILSVLVLTVLDLN